MPVDYSGRQPNFPRPSLRDRTTWVCFPGTKTTKVLTLLWCGFSSICQLSTCNVSSRTHSDPTILLLTWVPFSLNSRHGLRRAHSSSLNFLNLNLQQQNGTDLQFFVSSIAYISLVSRWRCLRFQLFFYKHTPQRRDVDLENSSYSGIFKANVALSAPVWLFHIYKKKERTLSIKTIVWKLSKGPNVVPIYETTAYFWNFRWTGSVMSRYSPLCSPSVISASESSGFFWSLMPVSATTYPLIPQQLTLLTVFSTRLWLFYLWARQRLLRNCMSPECFFGCINNCSRKQSLGVMTLVWACGE